jgi:hypothetical protein
MLAHNHHPVPLWQEYALLEMTTIPIPHEWKRPNFKWKRLKWSKLWMLMDSDKGQANLAELFRLGEGGLAVICGRPSENLFVIDCDTRETLAAMRYELWKRGIIAPVVLSSRGGHIYLRSREGAVKSIAAGTVPSLEVQGDGALVVLPPTRHKSGIVYQWDGQMPRHIPTVSIEEIDFLVDTKGQMVQLQTATSERRLHDDTRRYLLHGRQMPEGQRNQALFDASRDYAYVGKDFSHATIDLLPIAIASGLCESEASATIASAFAGKRPEAEKTSTGMTARLEAFMDGAKWEGRTGKTDKAIFAALIERRRMDSYQRTEGNFRASYRELMTIARINGWRTVRRAIERLKLYGYIEAVGQDKETSASLYRFTEMVIAAGAFFQVQNVHTKQQGALRSSYCGHFAQLSESQALGKTGLAILQAIRIVPTPQRPDTIAASFGIHRTTASRHLKRLHSLGLLIIHPNGAYSAATTSASHEAEICRQTGAYKSDIERQIRFDMERAQFALMPVLEYLFVKNQRKQEATKS